MSRDLSRDNCKEHFFREDLCRMKFTPEEQELQPSSTMMMDDGDDDDDEE